VAFPNDNTSPPQFAERTVMQFVPGSVSFQLRHPELSPIARCRAIFATTMPMPETTVNENHRFVFRQNNIGSAWEIFSMQAEAKSHFVQERADAEFG
jgi:hypothetical protein